MTAVSGDGRQKQALLVLGCPQVPVQTTIALYLASQLRKRGVIPVIAGNRAARTLVELSDPSRHYIGEVLDLDRCIAELAEKKRDFDLDFVFIHNDSGVVYAATIREISKGALVTVIFGEHAEEVAATIDFPCEKIIATAAHNPMPLKQKLDEVLPWAVSNL
ncbi:MAG: DUF1890 domain-containing protein [Methanoregulaceae archaeon]|nr:DUF1890 domain-containing protein [Methanoregulaceae archaeon]